MAHIYYSQRNSLNPNPDGLPLRDVIDLFLKLLDDLIQDGYFVEALGYTCVDAGFIEGTIRDVEFALLLAVRKKNLWPIELYADSYSEDDFFDVIEFLFQHVSKPAKGTLHNYGDCGMHWETFDAQKGREHYLSKVNAVLAHYERRFELAETGEILNKPDAGFEQLMTAEMPTKNISVIDRVAAAGLRYRRHGATVDDRRQAVRDLVDVLEYLKPEIKQHLTTADEKDLFNIANNFGIRHHNDKQKTAYDANLWLSWMFYYYLATIHVVVRKMSRSNLGDAGGG